MTEVKINHSYLPDDKFNKTNNFVPILIPNDIIKQRLKKISNYYEMEYKKLPEFFVRVPGRVNLIGEHIDYSGYPVCPMAIEHDILIAVGRNISCGIHIANIDEKYSKFYGYSLSKCREEIESEKIPHWWKYFLCGIVGGLLEVSNSSKEINKSLAAVVWGTIPPAAGLSSSSALVSSGVLAATVSHELWIPREVLVERSAKSERLIGTEGGAMDHAIAFLGKEGTAELIEFNPLRTTDVKLPHDSVFIIIDTIERHNKAQCNNYNNRVTECKLAAKIIAIKFDKSWKNINTLYDVQKQLDKDLKQMSKIAMDNLKTYNINEICDIMKVTVQQLQDSSVKVEHNDKRLFAVGQRAQHVYDEALRVMEFQNICKNKECNDQINQLGKLMNQSHKSLKNLFDCSTERIDRVVDIAIDCGAAGARLTGAGFIIH